MNTRSLLLTLLIGILPYSAFAQIAASSASAGGPEISRDGKTRFFPLSAVKEGMHGTARTVFHGSEPEEFSVEILGVIPGGIGPKQDLIVGRLSGGSAERTSVFAGMSGSPVYIDGKLVGAISYSFPFSKEPICGITPIEQMIAIFEQKPGAAARVAEPREISFAELASTSWEPNIRSTSLISGSVPSSQSGSRMAAAAGQSFQPIATPMTFSGFSQETLALFAPMLIRAGLTPVAAAGGTSQMTPMKVATDDTLLGGDSVSMHLTRGDYSMAAAGTVTLRDGNRIYAFGHPFLSLGSSDLPMSEGHVVTVIPNINNSFKLAVPDAMVGAMTQDRATGVFGTLGQAPKMIPVRLNIETSRGQHEKLEFEVVRDEFLTPLMLNIALYNAATSQERSLGDTSVSISGSIKIEGQKPVEIERRFAGGQAMQMASASIAVPTSVLLKSGFDESKIEEIDVTVRSEDGSKMATLERIAVDRTQIRAGESVDILAYARTTSGKVFVQKIPVQIPKDAAAGQLSITVSDGGVVQQASSIQHFVPRNLAELITTMNKAKMPDRLYAQTIRTSGGAIIGASEMPNLPPSVLATINNDRTAGGVKPSVQTVVSEMQVPQADFIIAGQQTLTINVIR